MLRLLDHLRLRIANYLQKRKPTDERAEPSNRVRTLVSREKKAEKPRKKAAATGAPKKAKKAKARRASPDIPPEERRRSSRRGAVSTYTERDSDDDDEEMLDGVAEWQYLEEKGGDDEGASGSESESELSDVPSGEGSDEE